MLLRLTLVHSVGPRRVFEQTLAMEEPCSVDRALKASKLFQKFPELESELTAGKLSLGVWGKKVNIETALADSDRIEIYRPLVVDPKLARRRRFATQGARTTGLFAKSRAGGKPGY